jgi:hypothetical protein
VEIEFLLRENVNMSCELSAWEVMEVWIRVDDG